MLIIIMQCLVLSFNSCSNAKLQMARCCLAQFLSSLNGVCTKLSPGAWAKLAYVRFYNPYRLNIRLTSTIDRIAGAASEINALKEAFNRGT
jgi:hypothetical protein